MLTKDLTILNGTKLGNAYNSKTKTATINLMVPTYPNSIFPVHESQLDWSTINFALQNHLDHVNSPLFQ
jgi:hypothetical protein